MRPVVDPDNCPAGALRDQLNVYEAICRLRGTADVSETDVRAYLSQGGFGDLAEAFKASYFVSR